MANGKKQAESVGGAILQTDAQGATQTTPRLNRIMVFTIGLGIGIVFGMALLFLFLRLLGKA